eukprot:9008309-Prorocentrum_lima.AAC.1
MLEWIASINSEMQNFKRLASLRGATPEERLSYKGGNTSMQDGVCQQVPDTTTDQGKQVNQVMEGKEQD